MKGGAMSREVATVVLTQTLHTFAINSESGIDHFMYLQIWAFWDEWNIVAYCQA